MKRIAFHVGFTSCLLLLAVTVGLWGWSHFGGSTVWRSYTRWEELGSAFRGRHDGVRWWNGRLVFQRWEEWARAPAHAAAGLEQWWWRRAEPFKASRDARPAVPTTGRPIQNTGFNVAGVEYATFRLGATTSRFLAVPLWMPAAVLGTAASMLAPKHPHGLRRRRRRKGLCPDCGYDLRATPGRCPECGAATSRPAPAAA